MTSPVAWSGETRGTVSSIHFISGRPAADGPIPTPALPVRKDDKHVLLRGNVCWCQHAHPEAGCVRRAHPSVSWLCTIPAHGGMAGGGQQMGRPSGGAQTRPAQKPWMPLLVPPKCQSEAIWSQEVKEYRPQIIDHSDASILSY